jgi:hypothetical protein
MKRSPIPSSLLRKLSIEEVLLAEHRVRGGGPKKHRYLLTARNPSHAEPVEDLVTEKNRAQNKARMSRFTTLQRVPRMYARHTREITVT